MVTFGAVDYARMFYAYIAVTNAAHEAAVYASRFDGSPTAIQTAVAGGGPNYLATVVRDESRGFVIVGSSPSGNSTITGPTIVYNTPVSGAATTPVPMAQVQVTYNFQPLVAIPRPGPIPVRAVAAAPLP
jgi:Flp pilus assembly protein TadG